MPLRQFIGDNAVFHPHELAAMTAAFEQALGKLGLSDRKDGMTELVARKTIELAKQGERDAAKLCAALLKTFKDGGAEPGTS
jgi:hypothetical protein